MAWFSLMYGMFYGLSLGITTYDIWVTYFLSNMWGFSVLNLRIFTKDFTSVLFIPHYEYIGSFLKKTDLGFHHKIWHFMKSKAWMVIDP